MRYRILAAAAAAVLLLATVPALANWPTTEWTIKEQASENEHIINIPLPNMDGGKQEPTGERRRMAEQYTKMLEAASRWYDFLQFPAPLQATVAGNSSIAIANKAGENYIGFLKTDAKKESSKHTYPDAFMLLSSYPGYFKPPLKPWYKVMRWAPVHELYHAIQRSHPSYANYMFDVSYAKPPLSGCPASTEDDWLTEGTAAYVQIRWIERTMGVTYGHPFKGSPRKAWLRYFDQPLDKGSLPFDGHRTNDGHGGTNSWYCSYGTWYFWYAMGEMLEGTEDLFTRNKHRMTYLQYVFGQKGPWADTAVAMVDAGLRQAAKAYGVIEPYQEGLYDLYPQFVAQYLDNEKFFEHVHEIDLATPDLYETTSQQTGGELDRLASRAWKFRIPLPQDGSVDPYLVRFTLDAPDGVDRKAVDALHLIVGTEVAADRVDPTAPYVLLRRTDDMPRAADGAVEVLVRVANVARDAAATLPAKFKLRVEVGGFYDGNGEPNGANHSDAYNADAAAEAILAELPPGFAVDGPRLWACSGGADARAIYDLITPDEAARDFKRLGSGQRAFQHFDQIMNNTAIALQNMQRQDGSGQSAQQGVDAGAIMGMMTAAREAMQAKVEDSGMRESAAAAAREARAQTTTRFAATFVGQSREGGECQLLVRATLAGRHGGIQTLAAAVDNDGNSPGEMPEFFLNVIPAGRLEPMRSMMKMPTDAVGPLSLSVFLQRMAKLHSEMKRWQLCAMTKEQQEDARSRGCAVCTAGRLRLRSAEQGHVAGTFAFDVVRWPEKGNKCHPIERDKVRGHFNVTSTDDGHNDPKGIFGMEGMFKGIFAMPGQPIHDLGADN